MSSVKKIHDVKGSPKQRIARISACMSSVQQKPISPKRSLSDFIWPLQQSICRICCKAFNSPKAMCGHMRIHGSQQFPTEPIKLRMKKLYREMESRRADPNVEKIGHDEQRIPDFSGPVSVAGEPGWDQKIGHDEQRIPDFSGSVSVAGEPGWDQKIGHDEQRIPDFSGSVSVSGEAGHRKPLSEIKEFTGIGTRKIESFESQMNCSSLSYPLSIDDEELMLMIHNSRKKKMKVEVESEASREMKHECSLCKKRFLSHQALGGHKSSSHSKFKVQDETTDQPSAAPESPPSSSSPHVHQCKICQKMFQTGQALGGHMRAHWTGGVTSQTEGSILAIPNGFDLIELPVPPQSKEQDQKADIGYGGPH